RGHALFSDTCAPCHGSLADGNGPNAADLARKPANFTDVEFMRRETPFSFFNIISVGKSTTAMPGWADVLSLQDRWDLVSYLYTVQPGAKGLADGQRVYQSNCAGCHADNGDGRGAANGTAPPLNGLTALAQKTDEDLFTIVAHGIPATAMAAY